MTRNLLTDVEKQALLTASRRHCAICGSKEFLELCHIKPLALGGERTAENLIVLCPTCHTTVDRAGVPADLLRSIRVGWVDTHILGKEAIVEYARQASERSRMLTAAYLPDTSASVELQEWLRALETYETFDRVMRRITADIESVDNEDEFIEQKLKPLFDGLGFQAVTVLHHTGRPERGKDLVFYDRDDLGCLSFYAVVATVKQIHANSMRVNDAGHYQKIIDQVSKCFRFPYRDDNLKGEFFVDKVVVATASSITDEAVEAFRLWENENHRRLIFLRRPDIAAILLKRAFSRPGLDA